MWLRLAALAAFAIAPCVHAQAPSPAVPPDVLTLDDAIARAPQNRLVDIEDVGNTCAFLASDAARALTGEVTYVDGGFNIMA